MAHLAYQLHQFVVGRQRKNGEAGAHLTRVVVDGSDRPRLDQHAHQRRTKRWGARVSGFQFVQRTCEFTRFAMYQFRNV